MKIAIVHPSLKTKGGAENVVMWLAEELSRRGHKVKIFTSEYDDSFYGSRKNHQFEIAELHVGGYKMRPYKWVWAGFKLRRDLANYDIVNPHNFPAYIWTYFAKKFNSSIGPIVWFCEEPVRAFYPEVTNKHSLGLVSLSPKASKGFFKKIKRVLGKYSFFAPLYLIDARINSLQDRLFFNWSRRLDLKIVPTINLIVPNSKFIASHITNIFGLPSEPCLLGVPIKEDPPRNLTSKKYFLVVSRLEIVKNNVTVIKAVNVLNKSKKFNGWRCLIAGTGGEERGLKKVIDDTRLNDKVKLLGFVSNDDLKKLYKDSYAVVYLTLDETFGLPFLEAAFYGKPVIGPNHGGPTELVRDGIDGLQVDPLDPEKVSMAIDKLINNPNLAAKMGQNGRKQLQEKFTFSKFVDRFENVIKERGLGKV